MQDTKLYQQILGLSDPWKVSRVELSVQQQQVDVWVEHESDTRFCCPKCGKTCALYDHSEDRSWRHLDTCQFQTYLHARIPRVNCSEHGVVNVEVPWGAKSSRFTLMMERLIIELLQACQNIQSVCRLIKHQLGSRGQRDGACGGAWSASQGTRDLWPMWESMRSPSRSGIITHGGQRPGERSGGVCGRASHQRESGGVLPATLRPAAARD